MPFTSRISTSILKVITIAEVMLRRFEAAEVVAVGLLSAADSSVGFSADAGGESALVSTFASSDDDIQLVASIQRINPCNNQMGAATTVSNGLHCPPLS